MTLPTYLTSALRLATRRNGTRDGELLLVNEDLSLCQGAPDIASTLQAALDDWAQCSPRLSERLVQLQANGWHGAQTFVQNQCMAPLARAYQWVDASIYRNHARLMYMWRNEPIPPRYEIEPLVYQGGSDVMLGGHEPILAVDESHGIDLEAEIAVITTDVPMGITADQALNHIALVVLLNDVSLRGLIPTELARGFGFYQSKPATSFAPVALTPQTLGDAWQGGMLHAKVQIKLNGKWFGSLNSGDETAFHFGQIIAHLARTRALCAGSIVGAGTISNAAPETGSACITEARVRQILANAPEADLHPYLRQGDQVRIEAFDAQERSVFGAIQQSVCIQEPS